MLSRAQILERFALPDRDDFELEPRRDDLGVLRIKFNCPGDPTQLFALNAAQRLADEIRPVDRPFAERIDACVERARRDAAAGRV